MMRDCYLLLFEIYSLFAGTISQIMTTPTPRIIQNNIKMPSLYAPVLKVSSYEGYIAESAEMGTTVRVSPSAFSDSLQITVHDEDLKPGMPPAVYEYILTGLGSSIFAVDQRGYVYLNAPHIDTDPPSLSTYKLNIEAREVNTTPIRSSEPISIKIHVLDVNDNPPRFSSSVYFANVSASGNDRPVIQIYAADNDAGKNAELTYELVSVSGGAYNNFRYNINTHQLIAVGNLKPGERYQITLKAVDGGGLSSQAVVIVYAVPDNIQEAITNEKQGIVIGRNQIAGLPNFLDVESSSENIDLSERIQTYVTEISEATPPHSIIVTLGDDSTRGQVYYTIIDGNEEKKFAINSETGTLITVNTFDREETPLYSLQIETRSVNPDQHLYWTVVQVAIVDVNDNAPTFVDPQPIRIRLRIDNVSKLTSNMYVGQINVEDIDDGDNGHVELRIEPPMDKLFSIDNNGAVTINGDLLNGHFGEHRMAIVAMDNGDPPLETRATLIINIENALQTMSPYEIQSVASLDNTNSIEDSTDRSRYTQFTFSPLSPGILSNIVTKATVMPAAERLEKRLAPVFDPSEITVIVKEDQADIELVKLHASYLDDKPGSITYVILTGDTSLFSINSFTGSLHLQRALDAEEETSYEVRVGTAEAAILRTESNVAHTALVNIDVVDVNDWIPNFELDNYQFKVSATTELGAVVGQIVAYDQDRDEPNNKIRYRLKGNSGDESYFSINPENGLLTIKKDLRPLTNKKILLKIEAQDKGTPNQSSETFAVVSVEPVEAALFPGTASTFTSVSISNELRFSQRNYSIALSESARPPHLALILTVLNKPEDKRFIKCAIVSGNYGEMFSISLNPESNCELRTQMQLDREYMGQYHLNVSVMNEKEQADYASVHVTVLDMNDNAPHFIYGDNEYDGYFAALLINAPPFTHVVSVKAEDSDMGNSSVIVYSLNPFSVDSKYFTSLQNGEILTKLSAKQIVENSQKHYFDFQVLACDSPAVGQKLCAKADVYVNIISDVNRFILTVLSSQPEHLKAEKMRIAKTLQEFTGSCKLLFIEKMEEKGGIEHKQKLIDMYWYAVNPTTRRSCDVQEYSKLFDNSTVKMIAAKLQPQIVVDAIRNGEADRSSQNDSASFSTNFKTASVAMIVLAVAVAFGALIGICVICLCCARHRLKRHSKHRYPDIDSIPKFGTIFLPSPPIGTSHDMLYETQMLEIPIGEEDGMMKSVKAGSREVSVIGNETVVSRACNLNSGQSYYDRNQEANEGNLSLESMYAVNGAHLPSNKKVQRIMIPVPDYPTDQKKSVL